MPSFVTTSCFPQAVRRKDSERRKRQIEILRFIKSPRFKIAQAGPENKYAGTLISKGVFFFVLFILKFKYILLDFKYIYEYTQGVVK